MLKTRAFVQGGLGLALVLVLSGCSDEHPPVTTDSSKLTPGMEKMKEEMIKNFQTKSLGKKAPATPKQP